MVRCLTDKIREARLRWCGQMKKQRILWEEDAGAARDQISGYGEGLGVTE